MRPSRSLTPSPVMPGSINITKGLNPWIIYIHFFYKSPMTVCHYIAVVVVVVSVVIVVIVDVGKLQIPNCYIVLYAGQCMRIHRGSESIGQRRRPKPNRHSKRKKHFLVHTFHNSYTYIFIWEGKMANIDNNSSSNNSTNNNNNSSSSNIGYENKWKHLSVQMYIRQPYVWHCRVMYAYAIHFDHTTKRNEQKKKMEQQRHIKINEKKEVLQL